MSQVVWKEASFNKPIFSLAAPLPSPQPVPTFDASYRILTEVGLIATRADCTASQDMSHNRSQIAHSEPFGPPHSQSV